MKTIALHKCTAYTIVDDEDYEWASCFRWYMSNGGHAFITNNRTFIYLHRMIMDPCEPFYIDHKNGNKLDNRKQNLRLVTPQENAFNRKPRRDKMTSKFKGVSYRKENKYKKWNVLFVHEGRPFSRKAFFTELEAAHAYDKEMRRHQGAYAYLNFPNK